MVQRYLLAGQLPVAEKWLESALNLRPSPAQVSAPVEEIIHYLCDCGIFPQSDLDCQQVNLPFEFGTINEVFQSYFWAETDFPFRRKGGSILSDSETGHLSIVLSGETVELTPTGLSLVCILEPISLIPALDEATHSEEPSVWVVGAVTQLPICPDQLEGAVFQMQHGRMCPRVSPVPGAPPGRDWLKWARQLWADNQRDAVLPRQFLD